MQALVVYESMYGNTHLVAEAVGKGLGGAGIEVDVVSVAGATPETVAAAEILVVGGPTHVHGMTSEMSRKAAVETAHKAETDPDRDPEQGQLEVDPDAEGPGLRDWFHDLSPGRDVHGAAFDTRIDKSPALTGAASKGIARRLRHHHVALLADPESFFVDDSGEHLADGELDRAESWGAALGQRVGSPTEA